jgi:hypothetical protein
MISRLRRGCRKAGTGLFLLAALVVFGLPVRAQEPGEQSVGRGGMGQFAGMQRLAGEVAAVSGANVTVKTEDGTSFTVVTTDNTRMMKGRGVTIRVADLKPGDGIMAVGNMDAPNKTLHAAALFATDAAQVKAMRENLGKTYILGRVTAIDLDNAKMTVERPDGVAQTIGFDESTSFRRGGRGFGRGGEGSMAGGPPVVGGAPPQGQGSAAAAGGESITLADVKVGDEVRGTGAVKNGTFVPTQLAVSTPGQRRRQGEGAPGGPANTPGSGPGNGPGSGPGTGPR